MRGGRIIENLIVPFPNSSEMVRRLWCIDNRLGEHAVYADLNEAEGVSAMDLIYWRGNQIFWTTSDETLKNVPIRKIGYAFDPVKAQRPPVKNKS